MQEFLSITMLVIGCSLGVKELTEKGGYVMTSCVFKFFFQFLSEW
jgi:hypothetical protein